MNMLYRREDYPEEGELVLCKVLSVNPNSAFVNLEEYDKQGLIHISEISPGRIRNLYDYVKPGKVIVCKVLRINRERGHIDLSLRRVTEIQHRKKNEEIKQEQTAEKVIEQLAIALKKDFKKLYYEIAEPILDNYNYVFECFDDIVKNEVTVDDLKGIGIKADIAKALVDLIKVRIKPKKKVIKGILTIISYEPDGVDVVRGLIKKILNIKEGSSNTSVKYAGSGKYSLEISADNYKIAEKVLERILDFLDESINKDKGLFKFDRKED